MLIASHPPGRLTPRSVCMCRWKRSTLRSAKIREILYWYAKEDMSTLWRQIELSRQVDSIPRRTFKEVDHVRDQLDASEMLAF